MPSRSEGRHAGARVGAKGGTRESASDQEDRRAGREDGPGAEAALPGVPRGEVAAGHV